MTFICMTFICMTFICMTFIPLDPGDGVVSDFAPEGRQR